MITLQDKLKNIVKDLGVDLFGVADLTVAHDFILAQSGEYVGRYPRAISIGVRLLDAVVDELFRHEDPSVIFSYLSLYNTVNRNLDTATLSLSKKVQDAGFKAYPIPASQIVNSRKLDGIFSHKLAANLAGLGWIGKSCLLVTPEFGPRIRLATILTDAPLNAGEQLTNHCGDCKKCVDACPEKAFTGVPFEASEPRDTRFRAQLCSEYMQRRTKLLGEGICGLCVYICPWGLKKKK